MNLLRRESRKSKDLLGCHWKERKWAVVRQRANRTGLRVTFISWVRLLLIGCLPFCGHYWLVVSSSDHGFSQWKIQKLGPCPHSSWLLVFCSHYASISVCGGLPFTPYAFYFSMSFWKGIPETGYMYFFLWWKE